MFPVVFDTAALSDMPRDDDEFDSEEEGSFGSDNESVSIPNY